MVRAANGLGVMHVRPGAAVGSHTGSAFPLMADMETPQAAAWGVCLPVSGARRDPQTGVFPDHRGFRAVIRAGGSTVQAAGNARCLSVGSVDCTTVPAAPARVTADSRDMWVLIVAQVSPACSSATRVSSNASQQINTCPRMRGSGRWNTGRSSRPDLRSYKPRSAFNRFL